MSSEYRFSAYWKMYTPDGVQITFGAADNDAATHQSELARYMDELRTLGYLPQMPSLEDGEKIEDVDAFVLGASSKGDACVFLYSASHALQFRMATVYVEKFPELPFKVQGKKWEASAAPTREEAEKKGYLVIVPAFQVVMELKGKTEDGKEMWRFARVHAALAKSAPAPAKSNGHDDGKADFDKLQGASAELAANHAATIKAGEAVRAKLRQMAAKHNAPQPADDDARRRGAHYLKQVAQSDEKRKPVFEYLFGKDSLTKATAGEIMALRDWVSLTQQPGGEWVPSQVALDDAKAVFAALSVQPKMEA